MNLADISIRRPIFMTCLVLLSLVAGLGSIMSLGVDLFPDVTFPVVIVTTAYPGAGPAEVETLVSKPIEDELSTLSGIKRLSSTNQEGVSTVVAEFNLEVDVKFAEQQTRDRVAGVRSKLPTDIKEPVFRQVDPADQPIVQFALQADLPAAQLYDLANEKIKPMFEQVPQVGLVEIFGGRKREIQVQLDRAKLKEHDLSATSVVQRLAGAGEDIPSGQKDEGKNETIFRTVGQFHSMDDIRNLVLSFFGNEVPIRISQVGEVSDTLVDETSRAYLNGVKSLALNAYRQSGANTVKVADALKAQMLTINNLMKDQPGHPVISLVRDGAIPIRDNIFDVYESILIGAVLSVVVVFFFLANGRSTIITGLALPNSLIGAFVLMAIAGFTINIMSLLALSLSVGLLIDDAIVVRENIFRHIELGLRPMEAARTGTAEVRLAVIATTLTVIAVFGPLGFLKGVVGQFFKQFGLTVCFAMAISLFDALTVAPMLSAYFAGSNHGNDDKNTLWARTIGRPLRAFSRFQDWLEKAYVAFLTRVLKYPIFSLFVAFVIFLVLCYPAKFVQRTFLPTQDNGEFTVTIDMPPGTNLDAMDAVSHEVDGVIRANKEIELTALTVGSAAEGDPNNAVFYVKLVPRKQRAYNTSEMKTILRDQLKPFAYANPAVKDYDPIGAGQRPFQLDLVGTDQAKLEKIGLEVLEKLKKMHGLKDADVNFRPGKPEFQIVPDRARATILGTSTALIGSELRTQVEGTVGAKYRETGIEYDVRVRLKDDQRNIKNSFNSTFVPNLNGRLIRLQDVANPVTAEGPSKISRRDRNRYVEVNADLASDAGLENVMQDVTNILKNDVKLPSDIGYSFIGQAENYKELGQNMAFAMISGVIFILLVLASLYESFVTPFTIMLAMPLAVCGSLVALWLGHESLNIFSMIGIIMLLGVAVKNSILLVDFANQKVRQGMSRNEAIIAAGRTRLRPILMTTMALISGTVPIAIGFNEASKQRTAMGVAIIGGLVSSTLLTLLVVPAAYSFVDRFREWSANLLANLFMSKEAREDAAALASEIEKS
jgi:HAE1 family hydrophobic/amphiphilic exporter-1